MINKTLTTGLGRVSSMSFSNLNLTLRAQFNHSPRPPGSNYFRFILVNVLRLWNFLLFHFIAETSQNM